MDLPELVVIGSVALMASKELYELGFQPLSCAPAAMRGTIKASLVGLVWPLLNRLDMIGQQLKGYLQASKFHHAIMLNMFCIP